LAASTVTVALRARRFAITASVAPVVNCIGSPFVRA
jgi:hypothetical protein